MVIMPQLYPLTWSQIPTLKGSSSTATFPGRHIISLGVVYWTVVFDWFPIKLAMYLPPRRLPPPPPPESMHDFMQGKKTLKIMFVMEMICFHIKYNRPIMWYYPPPLPPPSFGMSTMTTHISASGRRSVGKYSWIILTRWYQFFSPLPSFDLDTPT